MARTPLLRALQRLAEEHQEADRLGIEPEELRERRATAFSRGEILRRAVALGGAAGSPCVSSAPSPRGPHPGSRSSAAVSPASRPH